ncbi:hypothetical protein AC578_3171 [Pseudocercospora eumusae]|uniref:Uncharacterized protein n=1 Tax=Pseudocercospora eumusae TaxID=321146 RepID=A0A139HDS0_9PEZI|nr:hypothetical protein AC578_3171 [Pseudocercospora eumusae]
MQRPISIATKNVELHVHALVHAYPLLHRLCLRHSNPGKIFADSSQTITFCKCDTLVRAEKLSRDIQRAGLFPSPESFNLTSHSTYNKMADPYTATRQDFTTHLTHTNIPPDANATFKQYAESHQTLLTALMQHPAMAPNLQQTYMTPANSKNKIYFMWDFVGRTLGLIVQFDPTRNPARGPKKAIWNDVVNRTVMTKTLLAEDDTSKLETMLEAQYPDQRGRHPDIGDEVLAAARALP